MNHTVFFAFDSICHRFDTGRGVVWAAVYPKGPSEGKILVYDEDVARLGERMSDAAVFTTPEAEAARNRFGVRIMLNILRTVKASMPGIRFVYERKSGANAGRLAVR